MPDADAKKIVDHAIDGVKKEFASTATTLLKRTPTWAVAVVSIMLTGIGCSGAFLYFNSGTLLQWQQQSLDVEHMKQANDRCHTELAAIKAEVQVLRDLVAGQEREIVLLKQRISNN